MSGKFEGKVAIITGAASGLGKATAILFAEEKAKVMAVDIDPWGGKDTVQRIVRKGGEASFFNVDVTKEDQIRDMLNDVEKTYGGVDILFNNAGVTSKPHNMPMSVVPESEWDKVLNVNLKSVFLFSRNVIPLMKRKGGGSIINVSSISALIPTPDITPYTVAKAGVLTLTKLLAVEAVPYNIRVNCIIPSEMDTPMLQQAWIQRYGTYKPITSGPLGYRIAKVEEVARVVLFLASDDASWISGACIEVTGARHLVQRSKDYLNSNLPKTINNKKLE